MEERVSMETWSAIDSPDGGYSERLVHFSVPVSWYAQYLNVPEDEDEDEVWASALWTIAFQPVTVKEEVLRDALFDGVAQYEEVM